MEQIWKICLEIPDFSFYELETPRDKLIIFDLYELEYFNTDKVCINVFIPFIFYIFRYYNLLFHLEFRTKRYLSTLSC